MEANTCENAKFQMPNSELSKVASPMNSHFERTMFSSKFCADLPCKTLWKYRAHIQIRPGTNLSNILLWKNNIRQNLLQLLIRTCKFQSTLHGKLNTLEKSWTFKDKCVANAEIFLCNLLTGPFIKIFFEGCRAILKERAF